jgi:DNA polymerase III subunit gamma/tau
MNSNYYEYRPQKFSDVVGNEINSKLLLAIAKNGGPSTLVLNGSFGCGKTTCARLFSKAVNCENLTDDICCRCESCRTDLNNSPFYSELDSSITNKVENIKDLYEDLTWVPKGKKRVITFDEFHLTSRAAQSALLKLFEDAPPNIYYVLCTTDKNAILPAIISRSLSLEFNTKSKDEVINNLQKIAVDRNINLPENVAALIALRSKGHMRDAHKLFEKYLLIGEKDFLNLEESGYVYLAKYFAQVLWLIKNVRASSEDIKKHKEVMMELVDRVMRIPIALLKDDYQNLFLDLAKKCFNSEYKVEPIIEAIIKQFDVRSIMNLYKVALDDFSMSSFDSDIRFQTALFSIYQRLLMGI